MPGKIVRSPFTGFIFRFICVYGILIAPWPGWNQLYSQCFRGFGQVMLNLNETKRVIEFSTDASPARPNLDSVMIMSNRDLVDNTGKGQAISTELDTRSIGWMPTALTLSLILATPVPWRRRAFAVVGALILIQGFILLSLLSWIWNNSGALSLMTLSPFWQRVAGELNYTLIDQLGASFSVPVVIWILVTFRLQDLDALNRLTLPGWRSGMDSRPAHAKFSGTKQVPAPDKHKHHSQRHDGR